MNTGEPKQNSRKPLLDILNPLWVRKIYEKNTNGVKEIIAIVSFLTYISIENYTLMWIKEDKTQK